MDDKKDQIALRKRTQITHANRTMFVWVAVVSVIIGIAVVVSIFLFQKLLFNEKVLGEKEKTVATLNTDNKNITQLESQVRTLDTNTDLASVKANPTDQTLQVVLDALPSEPNSLALGASLQNKLLANIDGLSLQSLQVTPVDGVESLSGSSSSTTSDTNSIGFSFAVNGPQSSLSELLTRLESSIRTIKVLSITIQGQTSSESDSSALMTVQAEAFYLPAQNIQLTTKVVKP